MMFKKNCNNSYSISYIMYVHLLCFVACWLGVVAEGTDFFRFFEAAVPLFGGSGGILEADCCVLDFGLFFGGLPRFGVGELPLNSAFDGGGGVWTGRIADAVVSIVVLERDG